jgi:hypothetical protein
MLARRLGYHEHALLDGRSLYKMIHRPTFLRTEFPGNGIALPGFPFGSSGTGQREVGMSGKSELPFDLEAFYPTPAEELQRNHRFDRIEDGQVALPPWRACGGLCLSE